MVRLACSSSELSMVTCSDSSITNWEFRLCKWHVGIGWGTSPDPFCDESLCSCWHRLTCSNEEEQSGVVVFTMSVDKNCKTNISVRHTPPSAHSFVTWKLLHQVPSSYQSHREALILRHTTERLHHKSFMDIFSMLIPCNIMLSYTVACNGIKNHRHY